MWQQMPNAFTTIQVSQMRTAALIVCMAIANITAADAATHFRFTKQARLSYQLASSLRLEEAEKAVAVLRREEPSNLVYPYLEHYIDFIRVISSDNQAVYARMNKQLLPRIDRISRGDRSSPYYLFLQAEMRLQAALMELRFKGMPAGLTNVKQAYQLLEENKKRHPDFIATYKSLGILHAVAGSIPDDYRWAVKALGGMKGSVDQGIGELKKVVDHSRKNAGFVWKKEGYAIYAFMLLTVKEDKDRAWSVIQNAGLEPDQNPLSAFILASLANSTGRNSEAIRILEGCPKGGRYAPFPYVHYQLGLYKLYRLDNDASVHFNRFIKQVEGTMGLKEAYRKLAWDALIKGNTAGYKRNMALVKSKGSKRSDMDKAAHKEAEKNLMPNPQLLKARLLFDGAYYDKAYNLLIREKEACKKTKENTLEYTYRLGRICHESKRFDEAKKHYKSTIESGSDKPWYFACNAALQLGSIYEKEQSSNLARKAYRQCLSMNPDSYKSSLHARAKAGLNRLN